ncbi:hypothetical protein [Thalassoglobus polymorphus]|uniref:Uncharacterized protein n=1 Tax=Thalassoglobus polymorphus TaxID=2527994 RepID=A0A517QTR1_9PLAN|nr:hypothetical protein [Thalassoglobus polymorphus]QDT34927.1 hypothetical protein Mal48_42000 [Thalassoglobus polymorphus]
MDHSARTHRTAQADWYEWTSTITTSGPIVTITHTQKPGITTGCKFEYIRTISVRQQAFTAPELNMGTT